MIRRIKESGVVDFVDNRTSPSAFLDAADVHVDPAVAVITEALEILLGSDIFSPAELEEAEVSQSEIVKKFTPLARVYKEAAAQPRPRKDDDPANATHGWIGSQLGGWGRFEGPEPDNRFTVLAGSQFRRATVNEAIVTNHLQILVEQTQQKLAEEGVLDLTQLVFLKDYTFDNWSRATYVVSGKGTYSGGYHWQPIE